MIEGQRDRGLTEGQRTEGQRVDRGPGAPPNYACELVPHPCAEPQTQGITHRAQRGRAYRAHSLVHDGIANINPRVRPSHDVNEDLVHAFAHRLVCLSEEREDAKEPQLDPGSGHAVVVEVAR